MSCRSTPAGSFWTTFARLESGLTDVQTLSAFHAVRAEGRGVPAPTPAEWERFIAAQRIEMEASGFTAARTRSLNDRLDRAIEQVPDGASWFALRNIRERTAAQSNAILAEINSLAALSGEDASEVRARYEERLSTIERGRSVAPEGYTPLVRESLRTRRLPADHGTFQVLTAMRVEAETAAGAVEERPRRVAHVAFPNSKAIFSGGYDPEDGRLEVVFPRRDREGNMTGTSRTYAYHGVPATVWARMCGEEGPGHVYNSMVRSHNEYKYGTIEEEEAAAHRRCDDCGQWWGPDHACPARVATAEQRHAEEVTRILAEAAEPVEDTDPAATEAPVADRVVVSQSADGRTRIVSAVDAIPEGFDAVADGMAEKEADALATLRAVLAGVETDDETIGALYEEHYDNDYYDDDYDGSASEQVPSGPNPLLAGLTEQAPSPTDAETQAVIADLRARLTGSPAAASSTAQARITEAMPEPVEATDIGIFMDTVGRFSHRIGRSLPVPPVGRHDNLSLPDSMGTLWEAAGQHPVLFNVVWSGHRTHSSGNYRRGMFRVTGQMEYSRVGGTETLTSRTLQCSCGDYEANYDCEHVREVVATYRTAIEEATGGLGRGVNAETPAFDPAAVTLRSLSIPVESTTIPWRRRDYTDPSCSDSVVRARRIADLRSAAQDQPVLMPVRWIGARTNNSADGFPEGSFEVTGQIQYSRPGRGRHEFVGRHLQCSCPQYQEQYRCPHVEDVTNVYRSRIVPPNLAGAQNQVDEVVAAQRLAEAALARDWTRNEAAVEAARVRHAAASTPQDSYSDNFEAFEADHAAAKARKDAGEPVIPVMMSNALGGEFTRESGRGFGIELEFDFGPDVNRADANRAIGQDLYAAGLTRVAFQEPYHAAAQRGYVDVHEQGWSFERDGTVAGEIVSPVMYDEPQTWETIDKICQIVASHGGIATARTGSHVHVGAPNMTTEVASELMQTVNTHEDIMYRVSQNPERPTHRPMEWCAPNRDVPQGGYANIEQVTAIRSHNNGINFAGVKGRTSDHPEIRHWDGSLSLPVIQAQVKISCGLVTSAERNAGQERAPRVRESVGSHAARMRAVRGDSRRALTSEEMADDTATFRSFIDTLFTRREDKAQAAALFFATNWQRS